RVEAAQASGRWPSRLLREQFPQGTRQLGHEGLAQGNRHAAQFPIGGLFGSLEFPGFSSPRKTLVAAAPMFQKSIANQGHEIGELNLVRVATTAMLIKDRLQARVVPNVPKHLQDRVGQRHLVPQRLHPCRIHSHFPPWKSHPITQKDDFPRRLEQDKMLKAVVSRPRRTARPEVSPSARTPLPKNLTQHDIIFSFSARLPNSSAGKPAIVPLAARGPSAPGCCARHARVLRSLRERCSLRQAAAAPQGATTRPPICVWCRLRAATATTEPRGANEVSSLR